MTAASTIGQGLVFAGLGGAKLFLLVMVLALPLALIVGTYLKRSRSR